MRIKLSVLAVLCIFLTQTYAAEQSLQTHPVIDTEKLITVFMDAVDRKELRIDNLIINRSMINPATVNYSYPLDNKPAKITVQSDLVKPINCPRIQDFLIESITAEMNTDGHIIDVWYSIKPANKKR